MIDRAFLHLPGIGRARERALRAAGVQTWDDLLRVTPAGPAGRRIRACIERDRRALAVGDMAHFAGVLARGDRWRLLEAYYDQAAYFDIETTGAEPADAVTVIGCLHRGRMRMFLRHENLEAFLDLLEEIPLLVSFNGSSFDVPHILDTFHIPELPCPHLDLRWICHHENLRGGLKRIEQDLGLDRPPDLEGVDGEQAVRLWRLWEEDGDLAARQRLLRYCAADVLTLPAVAAAILRARGGAHPPPRSADIAGRLARTAFPPPPARRMHAVPDLQRTGHPPGEEQPAPAAEEAEDDLARRLRRHWRLRRRG